MNPSYRIPKGERWLRLAPSEGALPPSREAPLDDDALIEAVVRRDVRRADELHDRLISVIESTLYRLMGKRESDHDDLVQATFEQVVVTLMRGRFSRGCSLTTWASAVAAHVAFNALRARRRARRVFDPTELGRVPDHAVLDDAERDIRARAQIREVQGHLSAMAPDRAMMVIMHDVLGHELVESAAIVGISVAAAQSRLVRGRRDLLRRLAAGDGSKEGAGRDQ
ncbi:MAG: RNA polymerase sigma factor [Myxococcota bacterium]|nr:RNA polymerase sigma factor [Myxococcota bacterium]